MPPGEETLEPERAALAAAMEACLVALAKPDSPWTFRLWCRWRGHKPGGHTEGFSCCDRCGAIYRDDA